ncbi:MAG: response regulator transcription factor [Ginsengibacter sp.]
MPPIKCLIVDDEPLARKLIAGHVGKLPEWSVVAQCKNAVEAYEILVKEKVDVLFLDINMPVITGVDFYRSLKNPPYLVFTTAYPEYAVEGFELEAIDYLVKPITFDRFLKAAERIYDKMIVRDRSDNSTIRPDPVEPANHIFIKHFGKLVKVFFDEILYLEAQKDFVKFVLKSDEMIAGMTMKEAEDVLPPSKFLRVHRSFIVSVKAITAMFGNTIEIGKFQVPIGANYKGVVMERVR